MPKHGGPASERAEHAGPLVQKHGGPAWERAEHAGMHQKPAGSFQHCEVALACRPPRICYCGGYIGRVERKTETAILIMGYILGLYRNNGKENGNYYIIIGYILGLYRDNGKRKWKLLYHNRVYIGVI